MNPTGEFELSILMQGGVVAAPPPEEGPVVCVITTLEELRAATCQVAASAKRLMSIYTPDLEPDVYDQTVFLDIIKRFVLSRNYARVRLLLGSQLRLMRDAPRLVAMGRRLTSYIDIRVLLPKSPKPTTACVIADDRAIVWRPDASKWDGIANFDNPPVARTHLIEFETLWDANMPDDVRRAAQR